MFYVGWMYNRSEGKIAGSCDFDFVGLNQSDPSLAIFRLPVHPDLRQVFSNRFKERTRYQIFVCIRHKCNDTAVVGLATDWDALEIACDWRRTVSKFMREELEIRRRVDILVRSSLSEVSPACSLT